MYSAPYHNKIFFCFGDEDAVEVTISDLDYVANVHERSGFFVENILNLTSWEAYNNSGEEVNAWKARLFFNDTLKCS